MQVANLSGASDACLRNDHATPSNRNVVTDLHEIVDLRALADYRVAQRASIDCRIRADLHIVLNNDTTELWRFQMPPGVERKAEPILPQPRAGMNDEIIAKVA